MLALLFEKSVTDRDYPEWDAAPFRALIRRVLSLVQLGLVRAHVLAPMSRLFDETTHSIALTQLSLLDTQITRKKKMFFYAALK